MSEKAVEVRDLIKIYRLGQVEVQALRGLTVTVVKGEMVAVIGPSGSGKSTLLNIIGGLDRASAGLVKVFDVDLASLKPIELVEFRRGAVGHIFQNMNLIPMLSAAENIELPLSALGVHKEERKKRVGELIDIIGLRERMNHKPGELSGGEQQRVAIAAALANDPPLILADEPTGDLDTENAMIVVNYLAKVNKELDKTIIMVTHDPRVARAAGRILRIQDGVIATDITPGEEMVLSRGDYSEMLKRRLAEIDIQFSLLERDLRSGSLSGDEYVARQIDLKKTRDVLSEELHRLGIVH